MCHCHRVKHTQRPAITSGIFLIDDFVFSQWMNFVLLGFQNALVATSISSVSRQKELLTSTLGSKKERGNMLRIFIRNLTRISLVLNVFLLFLCLQLWLHQADSDRVSDALPPCAAQRSEDDVDVEPSEAEVPSEMPFANKPYALLRTRHKRSMLANVQPLWYTQPALGYSNDSNVLTLRDTLVLPPDTTRICIDVGTYVSTPSSRLWWSKDPFTFVVAFEPNYFSGTMLTRVANPIMHTQGRGYWPTCASNNVTLADSVHDCIERHFSHVTDHFHRFLLIPVALSYRNEFATFLVGFPGRPDGGSLLTFRPKVRKGKDPPSRIQVGIAQLQPYLRMLPAFTSTKGSTNVTKLLFDTIKIDAQGVDELVLEGGGHMLARFACVIAELDLRAYNAGHRFDYNSFMTVKLKFLRIGRNTFVNPRFKDNFLKGEVLCSAPDVHHTNEEIIKALEGVA